jgi:hypothetical protein
MKWQQNFTTILTILIPLYSRDELLIENVIYRKYSSGLSCGKTENQARVYSKVYNKFSLKNLSQTCKFTVHCYKVSKYIKVAFRLLNSTFKCQQLVPRFRCKPHSFFKPSLLYSLKCFLHFYPGQI